MAPRGIDCSMLGSRSVKPTAASNIPLVYDDLEEKEENLGCLPAISCSVWTNMMFVVPVVLLLSIALGTSFYYFHEHWEWSTCYYYASQVLNGNMFDTPSQSDDDHIGLWFTLLLYVYGSTLMASAYGAFASVIVENSFKLASTLRKEHHDECRKSVRSISLRPSLLEGGSTVYDPPGGLPPTSKYDPSTGGRGDTVDDPPVPGDQRFLYGSIEVPQGYAFLSSTDDHIDINKINHDITTTTILMDDDDDNIDRLVPSSSSSSSSYLQSVLLWLGWEEHRDKYRTLFATTIWLIVGVFYGVLYEGWELLYALRFAIGTLSASGSPAPVCIPPTSGLPESVCQLGLTRSLFVGTYILIGVPLWAFTLGQFSMVIVERAVRRREMELMARPLTQQEFSFASKVSDRRSSTRSNDKNQDLGSGIGSSSGGSSSSSGDRGGIKASVPSTVAEQEDEETNQESEVLDFGEFVVLEMLRLRRIDLDDLASMRAIFDAMDIDKSGDISYDEVRRYHMLTRGMVFNHREL